MKHWVRIVEHDSWAGPSSLEDKLFADKQDAIEFVKDFNEKTYANDVKKHGTNTPEYYVRAHYKGAVPTV